ncbi:MAG: hypothetical protein ACM3U1_00530 [Chloroflexota bacterium]
MVNGCRPAGAKSCVTVCKRSAAYGKHHLSDPFPRLRRVMEAEDVAALAIDVEPLRGSKDLCFFKCIHVEG